MANTAAKKNEPKMSRALVRQETIAGYLFLLPSLVFFIGFVIYPMVMCVFTSFFDSTMNRADVFIGFQNYINLFRDSVGDLAVPRHLLSARRHRLRRRHRRVEVDVQQLLRHLQLPGQIHGHP